MAGKVDVLAVLGGNRMETSQFAGKARITLAAARRALRQAEARGEVSCVTGDTSYWRRGAANPLIWSVATANVR